MIEVKNLTKSFDNFVALNKVNLNIKKGSIYGLVGPNGAGKTTLLKNVCGVYKPENGEVLIDGENIFENVKMKEKIAVIPDDWYYPSQATIKDVKRIYKGLYKNFSDERFESLKQVFKMSEKSIIRKQSKGMQKQIAFWMSMSTMPEYLILDEPVDGLDPVMRKQVWSLLMADVAERQTTVLVSSHNLRELEDVCDYVGILDHGKVLVERSLESLQDNMVKMQVVFPEGEIKLSEKLPILHESSIGRVHTFIMRCGAEEAKELLKSYNPIVSDAVPLTLEEIFIYELGGLGYAVKDIAF